MSPPKNANISTHIGRVNRICTPFTCSFVVKGVQILFSHSVHSGFYVFCYECLAALLLCTTKKCMRCDESSYPGMLSKIAAIPYQKIHGLLQTPIFPSYSTFHYLISNLSYDFPHLVALSSNFCFTSTAQ